MIASDDGCGTVMVLVSYQVVFALLYVQPKIIYEQTHGLRVMELGETTFMEGGTFLCRGRGRGGEGENVTIRMYIPT